MKEVVIIASAQYDKSRLMGSEIDSFKDVVKMNRFVTGPYEKHLGSKCTMWVCNRKLILGKTPFGYLYRDQWESKKRQHPELKKCLMVTYIETKEELKELTEWADKDEFLEVANTLSAMSYIQEKWNQLISSGKMKKPSTGLLTILYFTTLYDVVHLYNFDHGATVHYWGNLGKADQPMAAVHDWSFDKRVIDELVNEGKVVYL
jgi:hypothetical protein|tara:strand:- start:476 stop:1087 length:612 start_codon:yes stop_codon:yes gene_type:complete